MPPHAPALPSVQLLLEAGDYGGALDVLDEARAAVESDELGRLHMFRHVPPRRAAPHRPRPQWRQGIPQGASWNGCAAFVAVERICWGMRLKL